MSRISQVRRRLATAVALVLVAAGSAACNPADLAFTADESVAIVAPADLATVTPPFTLRWEMAEPDEDGGRTPLDDAAFFAVLIDVHPMPPGADVSHFAGDDEACKATPGCPDEFYLQDRGVFLTTETELEITALDDERPEGRHSEKDGHDITIVLLDEDMRRLGESAFSVRVFVDRAASDEGGAL